MTSRQETRSGRRWILVALLVFLLCLVLWIAAAFILNIAFAEGLPFSLGLRSRLAANYGPDELVGSLGVFRLSIIDEVLLDRGMSPEEAEEQSERIKEAMSSPVPTATARDFKGNEPFTATPTEPPTATITEIPTETPTSTNALVIIDTATNTSAPATNTPIVPSKTPTFGPSPTASSTPSLMPSLTPSPTQCFVNPIVEILAPPDWETYVDGQSLPAQAFAYDPDNVDPGSCQPIGVYPSDDGAGIDRVEFQIEWVDGGGVIVYERTEYTSAYCGFGGDGPCPSHPVSSSNWPFGGGPINAGLHKLLARAQDDGGNWSDWEYVYFNLDLVPTPTPTFTPSNTPTFTSTFTPTPSRTPTHTPTNTSTFTPTPTDTPTRTPSSTPSPTFTPSPTNTPTDTPTPTPTDTPTPTTDVCSLITITGFNDMGNDVWWTVTNGNSTAITIIGININWPTFNGDLNIVRWNGSIIWNAGPVPPPAIINTGWTAASRVIDPGQSSELRFSFENNTWFTGYSLVVTFDNGCMPSKND